MAKIAIDAGHGGRDPGAVYEGRQEKDDNLRLALAVGEILEENGAEVFYTRTEDVYQTPYQKAQAANAAGADYFVSLHRNSSPMPNQYTGAETLVYDDSGKKAVLAEAINGELEEIGYRNLGVKERPGLVVLRRTKMPAVLVETGFINSEEDNRLFDEEFDAIAQGIAGAILETAGVATGQDMGEAVQGTEDPRGSVEASPAKSMEKEQETDPPCPCLGKPGKDRPDASGKDAYYRVQTGAFRNRDNAVRQREELKNAGYPAFIAEKDGYYVVQVGAFKNFSNAVRLENDLRQRGYQTYIAY